MPVHRCFKRERYAFSTSTKRVYRASVGISTGGVLSIVSSPDFVFCGSGDGTVKKLRGYDQRWTLEGEAQFDGRVVSMSVSADNLDILVGTDAGKMYRLLIDDMSTVQLSSSHITSVVDVAFGTAVTFFVHYQLEGKCVYGTCQIILLSPMSW